MKSDIHPKYKPVIFSCVCGASFLAGSTMETDEFKTEICSNCHPFFTGKQKLVDSSGRVEKFMAKMKKAQAEKEKAVKKVKKGTFKKMTGEMPEEETTETEKEEA